jgi:hypothetical protein
MTKRDEYERLAGIYVIDRGLRLQDVENMQLESESVARVRATRRIRPLTYMPSVLGYRQKWRHFDVKAKKDNG